MGANVLEIVSRKKYFCLIVSAWEKDSSAAQKQRRPSSKI